jgi:ABC-type transporter Mla MlaB component
MEIYPEEIHRRVALQGTGNMLRITVTENESEQRWVLQGRLTGSYVEELTAGWRANRNRRQTQSCTVDLNDVTCIDKDGEQVLLMMIKDGAKFVATGLYTKHLLESLSTNNTGSSDRH